MEFHIKLIGPAAVLDLEAISNAVATVDPSGLLDIDPSGGILRVATSIDKAELAALMAQAGYPVAPDQLTQVPSICCGGCSG